jgi:hypothetical protein
MRFPADFYPVPAQCTRNKVEIFRQELLIYRISLEKVVDAPLEIRGSQIAM